MYFSSVQFFLISLFSWDCWNHSFLMAQVLFMLSAAYFLLCDLRIVLFNFLDIVRVFVPRLILLL